MSDFFRCMSPNFITSIANVLRALAVLFLYQNKVLLFAPLFFIGYYFDCLDGHHARRYNKSSRFGDYYDHFSDIFFNTLVVYWIYKNQKNWFPLITISIICIIMNIHFGCQQQFHQSETGETIDITKVLCTNKHNIKYTRYFGAGTFATAMSLIPILIQYT